MQIRKNFKTASRRRIVFEFMFLILWIICCFNTDNADYGNYVMNYVAYGTGDKSPLIFDLEPGFRTLCALFYRTGMSFFLFRLLYMTVFLCLMRNSILTYAKKPVIVLASFFVYPFLLQCVQMRNAMATAIVIFAIRFLFENTLKGKIRFLVFVLIGSLFHTSVLAYALLVLAANKNIFRTVAALIVIEIFSIILVIPGAMRILAVVLENRRFIKYDSGVPLLIVLKHMLPMLGLAVVLWYCYKSRKSIKLCHTENRPDGKIIFNVAVLTLIYLPLISININFSRLYIFMLPVVYMAVTNISVEKGSLIREDFVLLKLFCLVLACFYFVMLIGPGRGQEYENVTRAIFNNNFLLELLR